MAKNINKAIISLLLPVTLLVLLPFVLSRYYLDLSIVFLINLILAASFRMISTTGDFSLAHVPLMGMGAYTSAIISKQLGLPFLITLRKLIVVFSNTKKKIGKSLKDLPTIY